MLRFVKIFLFMLLFSSLAASQTRLTPEAQRAEQIINQAFLEKNPDKRKEIVIALSLEGSRNEVFSLLDKALEDKDAQVRLAACASLAALKDKRSIALLEKALNDDVPEVSFAAAQALWQMDNATGKEILIAILEGEKKSSSGYITKQKRDAMRLMKNPSGLFKFAVKMGIGFAPVPGLGTGISSMESLLKDGNISGRALAALLLSRDKDAATLEVLREALTDKDWSVRAAAIHSLALRNETSIKEELVLLMEDKKDEVKYRAAAAYLRLELITLDQRNRRKTSHSK